MGERDRSDVPKIEDTSDFVGIFSFRSEQQSSSWCSGG